MGNVLWDLARRANLTYHSSSIVSKISTFDFAGGDKGIDVIDVARQADSKMKLKEFVKYYYQPQRPKVLNVISLEFSDTK